MSRYLRYRVEGGAYFFTLVTFERRRFLTTEMARTALRSAMKSVQAERAFDIIAIVLLPDHLHCILELPRGDSDYSTRWRLIKSRFTRQWLENNGTEGHRSASYRSKSERAVWQRRFYEHTVRDEEDLERCVDYVHWNPVKHKFVSRVCDYPWSSFHRFVLAKHYENNWGGTNPTPGFEFPE